MPPVSVTMHALDATAAGADDDAGAELDGVAEELSAAVVGAADDEVVAVGAELQAASRVTAAAPARATIACLRTLGFSFPWPDPRMGASIRSPR